MTDLPSSSMWDARYADAASGASTVWSLEPNAWIADTVVNLPAGRAIDLGAGEGRNALWLASLWWEVTAVDFSSVGLATGEARATSLGPRVLPGSIEWVTADATTWRSPHPVELVVMAYLQLPVDALAAAIGNSLAALAPGGTLALIAHDRDNLERGVGGPQNPDILTTVGELRAAVAAAGNAAAASAASLDIIECRQFERGTPAGTAIDAILVVRRAAS